MKYFFVLIMSLFIAGCGGDSQTSNIESIEFPSVSSKGTSGIELQSKSDDSERESILNSSHKVSWAYYTGYLNKRWYISEATSGKNSYVDIYSLMAIKNGNAGWGTVAEQSMLVDVNENEYKAKSNLDYDQSPYYYDVGWGEYVTDDRILEDRVRIQGHSDILRWYFFKVESTGLWYIINTPEHAAGVTVIRRFAEEDGDYAWGAPDTDDLTTEFFTEDGIRKVRFTDPNDVVEEIAPPELYTPSNSSTISAEGIYFSWENVNSDSDSYRLVIGLDSEFNGFTDDGGNSSCVSGQCATAVLSDTSFTAPSLASGKTYYWKVRNAETEWSDVYSFTTEGSADSDTFPSSSSVDSFVDRYEGTCNDQDGYYGCQCVDLVHLYIDEVLGVPRSAHNIRGNAYPIYSGLGSSKTISYGTRKIRLDKVPNTPSGIPQKGDIIFWSHSNGIGHVGIFIEGDVNSFTSLDQNWYNASVSYGSSAALVSHSYTGSYSVAGWLRPVLVSE